MVQHISDGSHAQVSVHYNLDPSGRLVVMEFVTASLEGQEAVLPAEMRRMLRNRSEISPKEILLISSRLTPSSLNMLFVGPWLTKDTSHLHPLNLAPLPNLSTFRTSPPPLLPATALSPRTQPLCLLTLSGGQSPFHSRKFPPPPNSLPPSTTPLTTRTCLAGTSC